MSRGAEHGHRPGRGFGKMGFGQGHGPGGAQGLVMVGEKAKDFRGTTRRLVRYLAPWKYQLVAVLTMAVLSTLFTVFSPKIVGQAITILWTGVVEGAIDYRALMSILATLGWLYLLSALFSYLQQFLMVDVSQQAIFNLREDVSAKLPRLPLAYYDSRPHGETLSRVTNDIELISSTFQQGLTQMVTAVVTMVGVIIMMLLISPLMTVITFVALPLGIAVARPVIKRSQKYFKEQQEALGALNGHVEEVFTGHKEIKSFGREEKVIAEFAEHNERLYAAGWRAQFISGMIMPLMHFVNNVAYIIVAVAGSIFAAHRLVQVGDIQAFIQYARHFSQPITQTAQIANLLQSTVAAAERVFEILDETEEIPDSAEPKVIAFPRGEVRFEDVEFSYVKGEPLISQMNIAVRPGQTVAIVGPTGAGKTTLVNLLLRFYELDAGRITIDGVDIREMTRGDLRKIFGMVLQDTWLFHGTISENIAYGRAGATDEEIVAAAKAANADHFIRTLPEGYATVINEEASNLSQGQKQLLTIARAILADPPILILDEATSNVDTRTEVLVQQAMTKLMKGRTSFVIAHRLSTIKNADLILVINNGRIIEQGTHTELLEKGGFYAELYKSQFVGSRSELAG